MQDSEQQLTQKISPYKIIYPVLIGLAVVSYMLYKEFDITAFQQITFTWNSVLWLLVAVFCMFIRDLGYVIRIRVLSGDRLSWIKSIRIIFLWEFTSAVTPSAIGGTSLAILLSTKKALKSDEVLPLLWPPLSLTNFILSLCFRSFCFVSAKVTYGTWQE